MVASADTLFDVLDSAFGSVGEVYFRRVMRSSVSAVWTSHCAYIETAVEDAPKL